MLSQTWQFCIFHILYVVPQSLMPSELLKHCFWTGLATACATLGVQTWATRVKLCLFLFGSCMIRHKAFCRLKRYLYCPRSLLCHCAIGQSCLICYRRKHVLKQFLPKTMQEWCPTNFYQTSVTICVCRLEAWNISSQSTLSLEINCRYCNCTSLLLLIFIRACA